MTWLQKTALLLVLVMLAMELSACSLLDLDEDPQEYRAEIDSIGASATVEVGTSFEVRLRGTMGCRELSRVEQKRGEQVIRFVVWTHEKDNICPAAPAIVDITRTLSLGQAGTYQIEAGEATASVVAE